MNYEGKKKVIVVGGSMGGLEPSLSEQLKAISDKWEHEVQVIRAEMAKRRADLAAIEKADLENRIMANRENIHRMKARGKKADLGKLTVRAGKNRERRRMSPR